MVKIDLSGAWKFGFEEDLGDTINLPGTTSYAKKGQMNDAYETYFLTDLYPFEGTAWYEKEICLEADLLAMLPESDVFLVLERTRKTKIWVNGMYIGKRNSLTTPHEYELSKAVPSDGKMQLRIAVINTDYPTKGGHMTSQDTQTNWNGITGRIELNVVHKRRIKELKVTSIGNENAFLIEGIWDRNIEGKAKVSVIGSDGEMLWPEVDWILNEGENEIFFPLGDKIRKWSEFDPYLYTIAIQVEKGETTTLRTGYREFIAKGTHFYINGQKTFLRGKHDGLIFPGTGYAPTTCAQWKKVLQRAKDYGINHYRFHTCVPPEAAFEAADELGIYMQPELPFWGTVTGPGDKDHDERQLAYLIEEGNRILQVFGNHPSFVMMSLGNELWGNKTVLNGILADYKRRDRRHLYTQGSNNFQFVPNVLEEDDFFSGVRFSKDRLLRGSYAMCDAPLGHVQVEKPSTLKDYDSCFMDTNARTDSGEQTASEMEIQFGTTTKKVELGSREEAFLPRVPVVTHEIGQYETYPDFREIERYQGPLRARNFEVFRQRLTDKGLADRAYDYFWCSGQLAMACYREEIEAALRSRNLAGFQLLDLQDFSGQGTALVGVLNAFMEPKGLIREEEWRSFCSNQVLLARFSAYTVEAESDFEARIQFVSYAPLEKNQYQLDHCFIRRRRTGKEEDLEVLGKSSQMIELGDHCGVVDLCRITQTLPRTTQVEEVDLLLEIPELSLRKKYTIYVVPKRKRAPLEELILGETKTRVYYEWNSLQEGIKRGERIIYFPPFEEIEELSIEGTYCTDFWCYPMFRSISESVGRPIPVGTMGLLIDQHHPAIRSFTTKQWSTPQWWNLVEASRTIILDDTPASLQPILMTIDNFERNHKLSMLWEVGVEEASVLVCSCDPIKLMNCFEGRFFLEELLHYVGSEQNRPKDKMKVEELKKIVKYT